MQRIPCVLMRGGTSKGPVFLAWDLPVSVEERDELLLSVMGSGHELEIDGIGGGSPQTSKVAIVSPSLHPEADVDYLFVQVMVSQRRVDTAPNCGNMLCAVGPFAIEQGLVKAAGDSTRVRIRNLNTGTFVTSDVLTPNGKVSYEGDTVIDGVPGSAAPVHPDVWLTLPNATLSAWNASRCSATSWRRITGQRVTSAGVPAASSPDGSYAGRA